MPSSAANHGTSGPTVRPTSRRQRNLARIFLGGLLAGSTLAATIVASDMSVFTGFSSWWFGVLVFFVGLGLGLIRWRLSDALAALVVSVLVCLIVALVLWTLPGGDELERSLFLARSPGKLFFGLFWATPLAVVGLLAARFVNPEPE